MAGTLMHGAAWCWLVVAAVAVGHGGQTTFRSRVDSVRLDALVTAGGQPVSGLTAEDFEVRDNGQIQKVTMLGTASLPLDVTLVLDTSRSLSASRLAALRDAGGALLDALTPNDRSALITFNHAVLRRHALTSDFTALRGALEDVTQSGSTSLVDAMYAAIAMEETGERRRLLIVFSDGFDTVSWLEPGAVVGAARRSETVIYGVSTAREGRTPELLREVVTATGGKLLEVKSAGLGAAFTQVLNEFRLRYVLSYTPPQPPAAGWHRIDVRVKQRGAIVRARTGYHVGPR